MSLRSLLGSFSLLATPGLAAIGLLGALAGGCAGTGEVTCDASGLECQICDAYGCRPASPDETGFGGAATSTSSSGGGAVGGSGGAAGGGGSGTGGSAPCDPALTTCPCADDGTCPDGKTCAIGLCIDACNFSYECGLHRVCFDGACVPGCDASSPCDAGYACVAGACVLDPGNPACDAATPCAAGQICVDGLCTVGCATHADCAPGEVCDGGSHACVADTSAKPLCDAAHPCVGLQRCGADGYCHYPCSSLTECQAIDGRFVACDQAICKTQAEVAPECTLTDPCPAGLSCVSNTCQ